MFKKKLALLSCMLILSLSACSKHEEVPISSEDYGDDDCGKMVKIKEQYGLIVGAKDVFFFNTKNKYGGIIKHFDKKEVSFDCILLANYEDLRTQLVGQYNEYTQRIMKSKRK